MNKEFGELRRINITDIWKKEDREFTPWLRDKIEYLNDAIDIKIEPIGIEFPAGSFSIDILGKDIDGNLVIIENQYGKTNHDHLGKTLTYMAYHNAKTIVWICEIPRPEHEKIINWLNENTNNDFFLVKIELFQIDESRPYPQFTKICGPSQKAKEARRHKEDLNDYEKQIIAFWESFLEKIQTSIPEHYSASSSKNPWLPRSAGRPGLAYAYLIFKDSAAIDVYSDNLDASINKERLDFFFGKKEEIENLLDFGKELIWDIKPGRRSQKIRYRIKSGGLQQVEKWEKIQEEMINSMKKIMAVFGRYINDLEN